MIPILLTPQAAMGVGTLTASATLTATGRKAVGHVGGTLTEAFGFTATGSKATSGAGGDIAGTATLVGAGEQTAAGQGTITLHDAWTANDVWLVDDVTGLPLVDDVTGAALCMDGHDPQIKRTSGAGTLTQPAIFTSTAGRTASGAGNLHYVFNAMSAAARKGGLGSGAITESATFASAGVRVPTGSGHIVLKAVMTATGTADVVTPVPIRRWPIRRPAVVPFRMGHGHIELDALMWATGYKSSESDDELVLALAA